MSAIRWLVWILLGAISGCAAQQRRVAGEAVAATGALTVLGGIVVAAGCTRSDTEYGETGTTCDEATLDPHPEVGMPVIVIGMGIAVIGGILYGTGVSTPKPAPAPAPRSPPSSLPLY